MLADIYSAGGQANHWSMLFVGRRASPIYPGMMRRNPLLVTRLAFFSLGINPEYSFRQQR
jgi:hypothetical protein